MSSAVLGMPRIPAAARVGCTAALAALAVLANAVAPSTAEAATATVVGQGTYENTSSAIGYSGSWSTVASSQDSGGSTASLGSAGSAQLSFSTSGIRWITRKNSYSGIADVYLDGVKKATVDLYSATTKTQQVAYEVKGLSETTHTIKIVRTGTKNAASSSPNLQIDAFVAPDVHAPSAPTRVKAAASGNDVAVTWAANPESDVKTYRVYRSGGSGTATLIGSTTAGVRSLTDAGPNPGSTYGYEVVAVDTSDNTSSASARVSVTIAQAAQGAGTYENGDPAVTMRGTWSTVSSSMDSGGSYGLLNADGYAEVSFSTSGIRWISRLNSYSGIADVYLDGVKKASVDLFSATTRYQQVAYEVKGLSETAHTLRVVRTGAKNPSSTSQGVTLDAFVAPDVYPPAAPTGLVAAPRSGSVALTWAPAPESDVVGYRVYRGIGSGSLAAVAGGPAGRTATYTDGGLAPGTTYRYQVTALDAGGNESPVSTTVSATVGMKALPAGTYEDDDTDDITLAGSWSRTTSTGANTDSGGSFSTLGDAGYAEMSFGTSGVRWLARTNSSSGLADVYVDGVKKATVDLYSATTRFAQNVFEVDGLSETGHTIRIVRTGSKSAQSAGRNVTLDALVAPDVYAPSAPTGVAAAPSRTGATVTWTPSPEGDVAGYRVFRRAAGAGTDVLVGTTGAGTSSFADVGLADGVDYAWTVVARDTSGNDSTASVAAALTTAADPYASYARRYATCPAATTTVSTRAELLTAVSRAVSGTVIRLNPGSYGANIDITTKASAERPFWICGPRTAVIDNDDVTKGYGFRTDGATHLVLAGMTVRDVQKGVAVMRGTDVTVADLRLENIGDEAVHLKNQTNDSTVIGNSIAGTGRNAANYGEGVYIGTAQGNWCVYNGCQPDTSSRNVIAFNDIRGTTAESIEAKAGTADGTMWKNTLDGAAITSSDTDSLIQVMGNGWVVAGNVGAHSPTDAIQVWNTDTAYGLDNVVYANAVSDTLPGYVVRLPYAEAGNVVGCDNSAAGAALGMSNKTCQN